MILGALGFKGTRRARRRCAYTGCRRARFRVLDLIDPPLTAAGVLSHDVHSRGTEGIERQINKSWSCRSCLCHFPKL